MNDSDETGKLVAAPDRRAQAHLVGARQRHRRIWWPSASSTPRRIDEIEEALIRADLGARRRGADRRRRCGEGRYDTAITPDEVKAVLAAEVEKVLAPVAKPLAIDPARKPFVILVVGVNGSGKTTTIGKLAAKFRAEGRTVMLAAGDTFRAAAIDQLKIWGERTGAAFIAREPGADAAGLAFDAVEAAKQRTSTCC